MLIVECIFNIIQSSSRITKVKINSQLLLHLEVIVMFNKITVDVPSCLIKHSQCESWETIFCWQQHDAQKIKQLLLEYLLFFMLIKSILHNINLFSVFTAIHSHTLTLGSKYKNYKTLYISTSSSCCSFYFF